MKLFFASLQAVIFAALFGLTLVPSAHAQSLSCASLAGMDFSNVPDAPAQITRSSSVAATDPLPAYCRIEGYIATNIGFEIRIPEQGWNGKLLMQGCGGFCGSYAGIAQCDDALARGYACVATDLGHKKAHPSTGSGPTTIPRAELIFTIGPPMPRHRQQRQS